MRTCRLCDEDRPLEDYYDHPHGQDGKDTKCKECAKAMARKARAARIDYYREYDRARGNRQGYEYTKQFRSQYPNKARAHRLLNYYVRAGRIEKQPCEACGTVERVVAHHDDYAKPLEVRWLCQAHHCQWHAKHGEAANAA